MKVSVHNFYLQYRWTRNNTIWRNEFSEALKSIFKNPLFTCLIYTQVTRKCTFSFNFDTLKFLPSSTFVTFPHMNSRIQFDFIWELLNFTLIVFGYFNFSNNWIWSKNWIIKKKEKKLFSPKLFNYSTYLINEEGN